MALIPARYIGAFPVRISPDQGKVLNLKGERMRGKLIGYGDVILLPDTEVLGQTYWHDPHHHLKSQFIGPGAVVKGEHAGFTRGQLLALGYDFHSGRADFEPYVPDDPDVPVGADVAPTDGAAGAAAAPAPPKRRRLSKAALDAERRLNLAALPDAVPAPLDDDDADEADDPDADDPDADGAPSDSPPLLAPVAGDAAEQE